MANEKRLIDKEPIKKFIEGGLNNPDRKNAFGYDAIQILAEIEFAPVVDAVEVVRCKDCYLGENCTCVCCEDGEMVHCRKHHKHMDANAFCSDGWRELR